MRNKGKMATLKRSHNETSMKNKYDALKELEKGVPQKEVALRFGVQKKHTFHLEKKQNKNRRSIPRRFGEQKNAAREVRRLE